MAVTRLARVRYAMPTESVAVLYPVTTPAAAAAVMQSTGDSSDSSDSSSSDNSVTLMMWSTEVLRMTTI